MTDLVAHVARPEQELRSREKPSRDLRLDVFRGLAMIIIFIAHVPDNTWFLFIPARFGFSSAAELFVFCSGLASALAFGRVFLRNGWLAGTRRILHRIWQVYWAHLGLALAMIAVSVCGAHLSGIDYPARVGLSWFFQHPGDGLYGLMTLRFMPYYLEVLPMYLALLAMVPVMVALARVHPMLALALTATMWMAQHLFGLNLVGGAEPEVRWFFNPFAWQLVFFTGFAFGMGWVKPPALRRGVLFWLCLAVLVVSVPVNFWGFTDHVPALAALHEMLLGPQGKTNLNGLLYLHFLASAYVALVLVEPWRSALPRLVPLVLIGQQALATFIASILLSWIGGMVLDWLGRNTLMTALVNLAGIGGLIAVALIARDYRGKQEARVVGRPLPGSGMPAPAE